MTVLQAIPRCATPRNRDLPSATSDTTGDAKPSSLGSEIRRYGVSVASFAELGFLSGLAWPRCSVGGGGLCGAATGCSPVPRRQALLIATVFAVPLQYRLLVRLDPILFPHVQRQNRCSKLSSPFSGRPLTRISSSLEHFDNIRTHSRNQLPAFNL
ncbi:hypothetical protein VTI28DRAFT_2266 [Corynascus sepedonium]